MSFEATCERSPTTLKMFIDMVALVLELTKVERVEDGVVRAFKVDSSRSGSCRVTGDAVIDITAGGQSRHK
jgi:hypothetical protein